MKLGFVGTGAIAEAVIVGLMESGTLAEPVFVSKRSEKRSAQLSKRFQGIHIVDDNQALVDQVDTVFLSTLPEQVEAVLDSLQFRDGQVLVSLAAGVSVERLRELSGLASVHRIVPMPPNELGVGPIPLFPASSILTPMLAAIGTVIPLDQEKHLSVFSASSAVMAILFELIASHVRWIEKQGVNAELATEYSASLFDSLTSLTQMMEAQKLQSLSRDCLNGWRTQ